MLKALRKKLTLLCIIVTGILVGIMSFTILNITETQTEKQSTITFQNNLNSLVYKIQSSKTIDHVWLSQMEAGNHLIIGIEDHCQAIFFRGSWQPKTDRDTLLRLARQKALTDYQFGITKKPLSVINVESVIFDLTGEHHERYQAACALIPSNSGWQSLTLIRDTSLEKQQIISLRITFIVIILITLLLLFLFSWWLSGKMIAPIEASQKKQTEFVAAASHELRSPLAVIDASLSALASDLDPTTDAMNNSRKFLTTASKECKRMSGLISDLLILSNSDANTWSLYTESVEIDTLLIELYESYVPIFTNHGLKFYFTLPEEELPKIKGDKKRLVQAFSVFLDNAVAYTPQKGSVTLSIKQTKHHVMIDFSDTGIGIPDQQKSKVFDRFYRGDPSRNRKEHYGLGLAVAKEIISLHAGQISVSDNPEGGTIFSVTLPC